MNLGTGACRAVIYGQSGWRVNDKYKGRLTTIDNLVYRRAAYMGAANGKFKSTTSYDSYPHNRLDGWRGVTTPIAIWQVITKTGKTVLTYVSVR